MKARRQKVAAKTPPILLRRDGTGLVYMAVRFYVEVATSKTESVNLCLPGWMPFIPPRDTMLVAIDGDDYRKVEEVYYKPGEPVDIYLEFEEGAKLGPVMKKLGWKEAA